MSRWRAGRIADLLTLAATPAFGAMCLLSIVQEADPARLLCSVHASPWTGMATMYLLMSVLHLPPWLKRLSDSR